MIFAALQTHIARHALTYLIALLLGFAASLGAIYDNFWSVEPDQMAKLGWWQVVGLVAKCIAPFATTVVAYLIKSPVESSPRADGSTGAPFPAQPPQPPKP
jgi:hypothetical protein